MITRVYIDNYRCFTNFEWKPDAFGLLLGSNGSGKTTILDAIEKLRDVIVVGTPVAAAFL